MVLAKGSSRRCQPGTTGWCTSCGGTYSGGSGSLGLALCAKLAASFGKHGGTSSLLSGDVATILLCGVSGGFGDKEMGVT